MSEKVWFITGTSRGFGRDWAIAALERGDKVAGTARDTAALDDLVDRYGIGYVLIGPQELVPSRAADRTYWNQHATLVYTNGEYSVYKV